MENDFFSFNSYCEFGITSDSIPPEVITRELGIEPTRFFSKGDLIPSKYASTRGERPHNLWAIRSERITLKNDEDISVHIEYFRNIFKSKEKLLKEYKENKNFEIIFWFWIETDNAGASIELKESETEFLNSISNRINFTILLSSS